ncbi:SDR family oxidoreductase [Streptomyces sp. TG1A-8]|uniref:SDR family oxidoreductase n=1 Tax=Streptomyces sp. TG1A-8 TaxID=3051385 RepID=UPI00265C867F|nr:SDR family oxidoreductase [Streptomyces sp. TG1A-8]MDO0928430.1 SDR family oxidoreductase [Streptomyces sp. TG1A-8]
MTVRKNVLITGASSGLGEAMARKHAARGSDLALCARRADRLETLKAELTAVHPGIRIEVHTLDVNDHDQVFRVFRSCRGTLGTLDRVVVNAGVGHGSPVGTGGFPANARILQTNLVAALAQCEAAVEIFRDQGSGHLVVISSMSAMRGLPHLTAYGASKAGVATLAEGIRASLLGTPIKVTTLFPGYIESEMTTTGNEPTPMMVSTEKGVTSMMKAIEAERAQAKVPAWPWIPMGFVMRHAPLRIVAKS